MNSLIKQKNQSKQCVYNQWISQFPERTREIMKIIITRRRFKRNPKRMKRLYTKVLDNVAHRRKGEGEAAWQEAKGSCFWSCKETVDKPSFKIKIKHQIKIQKIKKKHSYLRLMGGMMGCTLTEREGEEWEVEKGRRRGVEEVLREGQSGKFGWRPPRTALLSISNSTSLWIPKTLSSFVCLSLALSPSEYLNINNMTETRRGGLSIGLCSCFLFFILVVVRQLTMK